MLLEPRTLPGHVTLFCFLHHQSGLGHCCPCQPMPAAIYTLLITSRTGESRHLGDLVGITSVRLYWDPPTPTLLH